MRKAFLYLERVPADCLVLLLRTAATAMVWGMTCVGTMTARADIVSFLNWELVQDPPNVNMTASATSTHATLVAGNGPIPLSTDIGYQSVNGATPGVSNRGYAFSHFADFAVAIDYDLSFSGSPFGALSLGFGVGEDVDGRNSAGVGMGTLNGTAIGNFSGAARVNDQNQSVLNLGLSSTLSGSLFVAYDAASGDISLGAAPTMGAAAPTVVGTYSNIQNQWNDGDLLVAFFLRSGPGFAWSGGGQGQAVFSNVRVLQGSPIAVPEPHLGGMLCLLAGSLGCLQRSRRQPI
jgi:hypothetical protein